MDHLGDGNACSLDLLVVSLLYQPHSETDGTIWLEGIVGDLTFRQNEYAYLRPLVAHYDVRFIGVLALVELFDVLLLLVVQLFLHN